MKLEIWEKGAVLGFFIWILLLIIKFFNYFYARYFVESLGSQIYPYLYFSYPNLFLLLLYGVLLIAGFATLGYFLQKRITR